MKLFKSIFIGLVLRILLFFPPIIETWLFRKFMKLPFIFLAGKINFDEIIDNQENYLLPLQKGIENYKIISESSPKKILDLGTGTGAAAFYLAEVFPEADITGLDAAEEMLNTARNKKSEFELDNVSFTHGDIYNLPFSQKSFDLITVSNAPISFQEIKKVLTNDGFLLLSLSLTGQYLKKKETKLEKKLKRYDLQLNKIEDFADKGVYILISTT